MGSIKDYIRLSLGFIQQQGGNNSCLESGTAFILSSFLKNAPKDYLWTRNSFNFNAHIPLLSDLDLTYFADSTEAIRRLYHKRPSFFIIGEINFYHTSIRNALIRIANPYELLRDPTLVQKLQLTFAPSLPQLIAFLLRQLASDQKWMLYAPEVRIQKWRYICEIMNVSPPRIPNNEVLLGAISNAQIRKDALSYLEQAPFEHVFDQSLHATWKYLFPQSHIWKMPRDEKYLLSLNSLQKDIMREQLKWEFWGIGCHYYWLEPETSINHLTRLLELTPYLGMDPEEKKCMVSILDFIRQEASLTTPQNLR